MNFIKIIHLALIFGALLTSANAQWASGYSVYLRSPFPPLLNGFTEIVRAVLFSLKLIDDPNYFTPPCGLNQDNRSEQDLLDLGRKALADGRYKEAFDHLSQCWSLFNQVHNDRRMHCIEVSDPIDILIWLQQAAYGMRNFDESRKICTSILQYPTLTPDRRQHCTKALSDGDKAKIDDVMRDALVAFEQGTPEEQAHAANRMSTIHLYSLCNDEPHAQSMLEIAMKKRYAVCRYNNRNRHPLLILSPVKEEVFSLSPFVLFFHDVIYKSDGETLKGLARERLSASEVFGPIKVLEHTRKSKVAWLESRLFPQMTRRLEAVVGMNPRDSSAEAYQVAHYTVAGHYLPHFDYFADSLVEARDIALGDRIATMLLYLTDTESGGRTAFPKLNFSVTPEARGAVFWFNMRRNETGNEDTLHAACPVLRGEKWAVNKWFRYRGQMLYKPCSTDPKEDFKVRDLDMSKALMEAIAKSPPSRHPHEPEPEEKAKKKPEGVTYNLLDPETIDKFAVKDLTEDAQSQPPDTIIGKSQN